MAAPRNDTKKIEVRRGLDDMGRGLHGTRKGLEERGEDLDGVGRGSNGTRWGLDDEGRLDGARR